MTGTALVPTGLVVICCGMHQPGGCCTPTECAPCCPECPTCVEVWSRTPAQRADDAGAHRMLLSLLAAWAREIRTVPIGWGTRWPISLL